MLEEGVIGPDALLRLLQPQVGVRGGGLQGSRHGQEGVVRRDRRGAPRGRAPRGLRVGAEEVRHGVRTFAIQRIPLVGLQEGAQGGQGVQAQGGKGRHPSASFAREADSAEAG